MSRQHMKILILCSQCEMSHKSEEIKTSSLYFLHQMCSSLWFPTALEGSSVLALQTSEWQNIRIFPAVLHSLTQWPPQHLHDSNGQQAYWLLVTVTYEAPWFTESHGRLHGFLSQGSSWLRVISLPYVRHLLQRTKEKWDEMNGRDESVFLWASREREDYNCWN